MQIISYKIKQECTTACPYIKAKKWKYQIRVGSISCEQCKYYDNEHIDKNQTIGCKYTEGLINKLKIILGIKDKG